MSARTDAPQADAQPAAPARELAGVRKPRLALFVATACGLGYIPLAPGTWGSLAGLFLVTLPFLVTLVITSISGGFGIWGGGTVDPILMTHVFIAAVAAIMGMWAASRAARFWGQKDPQRVVVDEVSGQHLAVILGLAIPVWWKPAKAIWENHGTLGLITFHSVLGWKYLLAGFILFRLFDIWKPFPARQAERLPGGWGIMADDWVAGIYAAIGLWAARAAGL
jgi:phosphatidylglycerophosphatase A